jgi:hypothetical protein
MPLGRETYRARAPDRSAPGEVSTDPKPAIRKRQEDHSRIPMPVTIPGRRLHQPLSLPLSEVLADPVMGMGRRPCRTGPFTQELMCGCAMTRSLWLPALVAQADATVSVEALIPLGNLEVTGAPDSRGRRDREFYSPARTVRIMATRARELAYEFYLACDRNATDSAVA